MTGRISGERFMELSADYEAEQRERKERAAAALQAALSKAQEATVNAEKFMNIVRKYTRSVYPLPCCGSLWRKSLSMKPSRWTASDTGSSADRTLIFTTLLSARLACPNDSLTYPTQPQVPDRNGKNFLHFYSFFIQH